MTHTAQQTRQSYNGNDATTVFAWSYVIYETSDLEVYLLNNSTGVYTLLTETTHYSVSIAGDFSGATVTMVTPPATGETLIFVRDTALTQNRDLSASSILRLSEIEAGLDRLTVQIQDQRHRIDRAYTLHPGAALGSVDLQLPDPVADDILVWNAAGDALTSMPPYTAGTVTTLAAGAAATVEFASDNAINFGIPRGDQGVTGPTGATGPQGPTGPAGADGDLWTTPVDGDIIPDGNGTRDLGSNAAKMAEVHTVDLFVGNNINVDGLVDGRDMGADGTKLDGIEASADVTDAANVLAALNDNALGGPIDAPANSDRLMIQDASATFSAKTITYADLVAGVLSEFDVADDATPQLGGNLDVNGYNITSTANGNINIIPNGSGDVVLGNLVIDADQAVGATEDEYVLSYSHAAGKIVLAEVAGVGGSGNSWDDIVNANILPTGSDATFTLGSTSARFSQLSLSGAITFGDLADHPETPATGLHQLWVRTSDNKLIFTDEAGTDTDITGGGGITWGTAVDANITFDTDSTYTIGADAVRPSVIYSDQFNVVNGGQFASQGGSVRIAPAGSNQLVVGVNITQIASGATYAWSSTTNPTASADTRLYRDAAGIIAQRNAANAQEFRVYNTDDGSQVNYERSFFRWSGNTFQIGTEEGGTGTLRDIQLKWATQTIATVTSTFRLHKNLTANIDDTYEIGATGTRFTQINLSRGITLGDQADHPDTPATGLHQLWVRSSDNKLIFTDEAGTDIDLTAGGSGITWATAVDANILPDTDDTYDIGANNNTFNNVYADYFTAGDTRSGIFFGSTSISFNPGGNTRLSINDSSHYFIMASDYFLGWSDSASSLLTQDVRLYRDGAGVLSQRNAANAQEFRVYNTYTDASNYESGGFLWSSNNLRIGTNSAGTGSARNVQIIQDGAVRMYVNTRIEPNVEIRPRVNDSIDNGGTARRWANTWTAGSLVLGDKTDHTQTPTTGLHQIWVRSSDNHLIYTDEAGTDVAISAGAKELVETQTISNQSGVAFTDLDATGYIYVIEFDDLIPTVNGADLRGRTSTNNGSSYNSGSNNYNYSIGYTDDLGVQSGEGSSGSTFIVIVSDWGTAAGSEGSGTIVIKNPSRNAYTHIKTAMSYWASGGRYYDVTASGSRSANNVVNAFRLYFSSGNLSGTFKLYRIKA